MIATRAIIRKTAKRIFTPPGCTALPQNCSAGALSAMSWLRIVSFAEKMKFAER